MGWMTFMRCRCVYSKSGLVSHEFFDPGVFYYSDQGYSEAAPYIGTVIVKPKVAEQFIELSQDGFSSGRVFMNVSVSVELTHVLHMIISSLECNGWHSLLTADRDWRLQM